ncbi:hypothetical protein L596_011704 [Steinernema carpocapsae]|uniref:lysozyme n=1 Tax=Steinernema carpocapsae TaxID=34508 RepID=A0A4U5NV53_STECR|nr:hypothetical protein L596_011704 [Steinernema carpocapsae]
MVPPRRRLAPFGCVCPSRSDESKKTKSNAFGQKQKLEIGRLSQQERNLVYNSGGYKSRWPNQGHPPLDRMYFKLALLAFFAVLVVSKNCLQCICQVESGCKPIGCNPDQGSLSCGYFQIKLPYYQDCGTPGKKPGELDTTAWKRCADDYNCASQCVHNYIKRYASKCPGKSACQQMSRLHNGGPNGCNVGGTAGYWNKVKTCCGCN